jgi:uncharacterized protein YcfJ
MNTILKRALGATAFVFAAQAVAQVTFYEGEGFRGRAFATDRPVSNIERYGFNDRASSVIVERGRWEICEDRSFRGRCVLLREGSYDSLRRMGLDNRISSVRRADRHRRYEHQAQAPLPEPTYAYRRRPNEHLYEADVTSVRAVVGPPSQRCWIERQQVRQPSRGEPNVGGAVAGAIIGGILGHQVGAGSGRDVATGIGVVAGAVIGANAGRDGNGGAYTRDVRRCETIVSTTPAYWDVTYNFRGVEHRVQMSADPGRTVTVNRNGEPRG